MMPWKDKEREKAYKARYYKNNRDKLDKINKPRTAKINAKSCDQLTDKYMIRYLKHAHGYDKDFLSQHPEVIEVHRKIIEIKRKLR